MVHKFRSNITFKKYKKIIDQFFQNQDFKPTILSLLSNFIMEQQDVMQ